ERPTRYGGLVDLDATIRGTRDRPQASGTVSISGGRVERISYQQLQARFDYGAQMFEIDARLDQAPGVWGTATGKVPLAPMRNDLGAIEVDATVKLAGRSEAPRISGDVTITSGTLRVDEILTRTLFQPYATEQTRITELDAVAAFNPWDRLGLDLSLHVPST